jgi:hypothetical protein
MKRLIALGVAAAFAGPVLADEVDEPRLDQLETLIVTAVKQEPVTDPVEQRLEEIIIVEWTAPKQQPEEFQLDDKTAALLAEIDKEL